MTHGILKILIWMVILFCVLPAIVFSMVGFFKRLVRTSDKKWARRERCPENREYDWILRKGCAWAQEYRDKSVEVSIRSDGLILAGQYFDFGEKRTVILIPNLGETLVGAYYYAEPYRKSGYNVLCIDNRAHGESEGKNCSLGYEEYRDVLVWVAMLEKKFKIKQVVLHGIGTGASCALQTATAWQCPSVVKGLVVDSMYSNYYDCLKQQCLEIHQPLYPYVWMFWLWSLLFAHANIANEGPIKRILKLQLPILMIHSRKDRYARFEKAQEIYEACKAPKMAEWFLYGENGTLKIQNETQYDLVVQRFLKEFMDTIPLEEEDLKK